MPVHFELFPGNPFTVSVAPFQESANLAVCPENLRTGFSDHRPSVDLENTHGSIIERRDDLVLVERDDAARHAPKNVFIVAFDLLGARFCFRAQPYEFLLLLAQSLNPVVKRANDDLRPQREERAEWQIVLPRNLAARDQQQAHAGTDYAAQQDRHEHWPPAEKCANHGKQLNVSSAHAFLPKDQGADPRNEVEQPPANEKSGDAVPPLGQHECSRREPNRHAGYRDTVWHD